MTEKTPREIIASFLPGSQHLAQSILARLGENGYVVVPVEPTNAMICGALQASLDLMAETGVDGLSPFKDFPPPGEAAKRCYRAMINSGAL